jgi:hypothetical protein
MFANIPLFDEITSNSLPPSELRLRQSAITHLKILKINLEGITIPIHFAAEMWTRRP